MAVQMRTKSQARSALAKQAIVHLKSRTPTEWFHALLETEDHPNQAEVDRIKEGVIDLTERLEKLVK